MKKIKKKLSLKRFRDNLSFFLKIFEKNIDG